MLIHLEELEEITGKSKDDIRFAQLLRVGNFLYQDRTLKFTKDTLKSLKDNFDNNVRGVKLAVDYFHDAYDKAAGWIKTLDIRNDGNELWMEVEWTEKARELILGKELRYISAELQEQYQDKETEKEYGPVLFGAGLTNRPHIHGMAAILHETKNQELITLLNNKEKGNIMTIEFEDIMKSVVDLTDDQKAQLAEKLGTVKASEIESEKNIRLAEEKEASDKIATLSEEKEALVIELAETKKKAAFDVLLSEGKSVESQREAFMSGDMETFAKNAVNINLSEAGTDRIESDKIVDSDKAVTKLNEIADEKVKKFGYTFAEAMKVAVKENAELEKVTQN